MKVLLKHGDTAGVSQYVGVKGELILDRDTSIIRIMDGEIPGGHPAININYTIATPSITGPLNGATQVSCVPILTSSAYSGSGVHTQSEWVVARDAILQDIVYASGLQDIHKTVLDLNSVSIALLPHTTYYVAVRYKSSFGLLSDYSEVVQFTTRLSLPENLHQTILPSWTGNGSQFGAAMDISGDGSVLVVSDHYDTATNYKGSVYVYERAGGEYIYKDELVPFGQDASTLTAVAGDNGVGISRDGNTIAITDWNCKGDGTNASGCCWVFVKSGGVWIGQQRIPAPASSPATWGNRFGAHPVLSHDGNLLAISAYYDDVMGANSGAMYIYKRTGGVWSLLQKLHADVQDSPGQMGRFGAACTANFETLVLGSHNSVISGQSYSGTVYVFSRSGDTWTQTARLTSPTPVYYGHYGRMVCISDDGTELLVAEGGNITYNTTLVGSIHYYKLVGGAWTYEGAITPPNGAGGDMFGSQIATDGALTRLAVKTPYADRQYTDQGSLYLYTKENGSWTFQTEIAPVTPTTTGIFPSKVSMSGDGTTMAATIQLSDELFTDSGSVYVYK